MKHLLATALLAVGTGALGQITQDGSAGGPFTVDFQELAIGINLDGVLVSSGVGFAERFAGQSVLDVAGFDQLAGAPGGPLALQAAAAGRNLQTATPDGAIVSLGGLGSAGFGAPGAFGNGSMAVLFSADQSELLLYVDGFGGTGHFQFYRRDGSLIQDIAIPALNQQPYGFRRDGGVADIAGFSLWGVDAPGISLEYIHHNVPSAVPEPGAAALLLLALAGLRGRQGLMRRASR